MPWNAGVFTRTDLPAGTQTGPTIWQQEAVLVEFIRADQHDNHDQDLAAGINACLNKNGQNSPTANISWGNFKITNLAPATGNTDAAQWGQVVGSLALDPVTFILTATSRAGSVMATVNLTPLSGGGSTGAPQSASYVTLGLTGGLTAERVLTPQAGELMLVDGGANSTVTLGLANTAVTPGTYSNAQVTVDAKGRVTLISNGPAPTGIQQLTTIDPLFAIPLNQSGSIYQISIADMAVGQKGVAQQAVAVNPASPTFAADLVAALKTAGLMAP